MNPVNTVYDVKRLIGRGFSDSSVQSDMKNFSFGIVDVNGKPEIKVEHKGETKVIKPEEISAMILVKMKETADAYLGKDIKDVVNEHKGRESFRPFAPMIRKERVDEFFTGGFYSEYMSCAWKANDYFRKAYPGVVHLDGTSRLQVVTREPHYTLLKKWEVETGCPVILNTSLNVKGQPIVNDCEDCKIFEQKTGVPVLTKEI